MYVFRTTSGINIHARMAWSCDCWGQNTECVAIATENHSKTMCNTFHSSFHTIIIVYISYNSCWIVWEPNQYCIHSCIVVYISYNYIHCDFIFFFIVLPLRKCTNCLPWVLILLPSTSCCVKTTVLLSKYSFRLPIRALKTPPIIISPLPWNCRICSWLPWISNTPCTITELYKVCYTLLNDLMYFSDKNIIS